MATIDSLAKIFTDVHQKLGAPSYLNFSIQIKRAVHEVCAFYWTDLVQSDQNQVVKTTASIPFVDNQYIYSLANVTDLTMPDWVEWQIGTTDADWVLCSVVNRDSLAMFRNRDELACSFYSNLVDNVLVNYIEFSYTPFTLGSQNNNFRIWYDPAISVNTTDDDATGFPPEYNYMLAVCAQIKLIPICIQYEINAAKEAKTDKNILQMQIGNWQLMMNLCVAEKEEWLKKWKFYSRGSRLNQGGRKKRSVMGDIYL